MKQFHGSSYLHVLHVQISSPLSREDVPEFGPQISEVKVHAANRHLRWVENVKQKYNFKFFLQKEHPGKTYQCRACLLQIQVPSQVCFFLTLTKTFHKCCQKVFAAGAADAPLPLKRSNSDALRRDRQVLIFQITTLYPISIMM